MLEKSGCIRYGSFIAVFAFCFFCTSCTGQLSLEEAFIRQDRYTIPVEQWQWAEGWGEIRQYFPRYFEPSGTVHVFVQNTGDTPIDITNLAFNGQPIDQVTTREDYAGPVIWYRSNPEVLQPGEIGMVYVRLRAIPNEDITITVAAESEQAIDAVISAEDVDRIRFGYVCFSHDIDRIYAYVENWTDQQCEINRVYLDGRDVTSQSEFINASMESGPALVEIALAEPLIYGSYHCIEAVTNDGAVAISQIRARDDKFYLGMVQGSSTPVEEFYAKFFNTLYRLHGSHPTEPNWWDEDSEIARLGFTVIQPGPTEEVAVAGATVPPGRIIYNNIDEPDAREPAGLEYMSRCGINAMRQVEPTMRYQRRLDPHHDTMVLVDRTYAPMNWLTYGELPDILMHDCYIPTPWMAYDLRGVSPEVQAVVEAAAPRPAHIMLWGTMNTGYRMMRSPTPQENDMSLHYAIGEGAKGIYYFLDWNSYPTVAEGGYFIGASRTNMLWHQMGRANAELTRIASLLAIGHPFQIATSDNDMLYASSLLCGQDNFIVVLVNRNHRVHVNIRYTKQPHIFPVENAAVEIALPEWFDLQAAVQVRDDGCYDVALDDDPLSNNKRLVVNDLETSMVLVLSQNPNITDQLTVPQEQYQAMLASEVPTYITDTPAISDRHTDNVITLDDAIVASQTLALDLCDSNVLMRAQNIETIGQLRLESGQWLGLFTDEDWHGESSIVFAVESDVALSEVTASLRSMTPNFAACANNVIGLSLDGRNWREDCSFKMQWNGGYSNETLDAALSVPEGEAFNRFYVRVMMRDPGIVYSNQATNIVFGVDLEWSVER